MELRKTMSKPTSQLTPEELSQRNVRLAEAAERTRIKERDLVAQSKRMKPTQELLNKVCDL